MGPWVRRPIPDLVLLAALSCNRERLFESSRVVTTETESITCAPDAAQSLPELPVDVGGFCLPAAADVRRYGMGRENGLSGICNELFGDGCELFRMMGLRALALGSLRDRAHSGRELRVSVLEFEDAAGAFGFVEARGAPLVKDASSLHPVPGARAYVGDGSLRLWRGRRALEVFYMSDDQTRAEALGFADEFLPQFAEEAAKTLDAAAGEPYEIRFFEEAEGFARTRPARLVPSALGISQSGAGASAELRDANGEYLGLVFARMDEPSAKDLLHTIQGGLLAPPLGKKTGILRARRLQADAEPESWYFTRIGRVVVGVGPTSGLVAPAPTEPSRAVMESRLNALARRARAFPPHGPR